ncbi:MAG: SusC/RagA family TonB-linked outer membrane protein [Gemmatimonadota bacterium]
MRRRFCLFVVCFLPATGLLSPSAISGQAGSVMGRVLSAETGEALDGVHVSLTPVGQEEPTFSALTRQDGRYIMVSVPSGQYVIRAELFGFAPLSQVVDVAGGMPRVADFRLDPEPISLSEIVVTGVIGSTQRTKLPFDVVQVRVADLPVPSVNAAQSLQGKVAGVQVVQEGGIPGAMPSILLRGATSLDASGRTQDPLYIVDEVIVGADLVDVSAPDIQSIEVVKGAAAASLYGSRAANGVVHIRTRRGAEMADSHIRYTLRSEMGGSVLGRRPEKVFAHAHPYAMTDDGRRFLGQDGVPCDWLQCPGEPLLAGQTAGGGPAGYWNTFQSNPWPGTVYDQVERFFTNGEFLQNQLTAEGRSGTTNFLVSGSYLNQGGIVRYLPDFSRANFRLNLDQAFREDLSLHSSVFYARSSRPHPGLEWDALSRLQNVAPIVDLMAKDPLDPDQVVYFVGPEQQINPLYDLMTVEQEDSRSRFLGSLTGRYSPLEWLNVEGNFSIDRGDLKERRLRPKGYRTRVPDPLLNDGTLSILRNSTEALNASLTASARWDLTDRIGNTTQLRYLLESQDDETFWAEGYGFAVADVPVMTNIDQTTLGSESGLETIRADGYFLITNFDLYDRYVVDALIRNDGSSLFGADERRQWYYRLGAAWRLSQEDFFRVPWVDELKFRYSVGTAGGRPRFNAQYETLDVQAGRIVPNRLGNRDLKPEHSTEHEMGMDLSLFDFRTLLSLTYAQTTTEDQILQVPLATYTGFLSQWRNAGTLESKSWEATLDLRLLERPELNWSAKLLFDATKTSITALDVPPFKYGFSGFYAREGEEIGTFYGTMVAKSCAHLPSATLAEIGCGQFAVNDDGFLVWIGEGGSFGNPRWGENGPIIGGEQTKWGTPFPAFCLDETTGEQSSYCRLGNSLPDYNLGLSTTASWRGLSAYALFSRSVGFDIRRSGWYRPAAFDQDQVPEDQRKPLGYYEEIRGNNIQGMGMEDGTFTKLRELSLAYRVGPDLLGRIPGLRGIDSITLRFSGQNLYTWTDYLGYDPDVGGEDSTTGSAVIDRLDYFAYPNMRTFTGALEVVF